MWKQRIVRLARREAFLAAALALGEHAAHAAVIVSQSRTLASNAGVSLGAQTVTDPMNASSAAGGQYTNSLESFAQIQANSASGETFQSSNIVADSMNLDATAFAGLNLESGASASGSGTTSFVVAFTVGSAEGWRVDADASATGALGAGGASLRLRRGSAVIFEVDTALGAFSLHRSFSLSPGSYELEALCSASLQGSPGSGVANASATLTATLDQGPASCAGDADADGDVDFKDLDIVLSDYGQSGPAGSLLGDLDSSGAVDFTDLNIVLSNYGGAC